MTATAGSSVRSLEAPKATCGQFVIQFVIQLKAILRRVRAACSHLMGALARRPLSAADELGVPLSLSSKPEHTPESTGSRHGVQTPRSCASTEQERKRERDCMNARLCLVAETHRQQRRCTGYAV